jgi:hypothetical protein
VTDNHPPTGALDDVAGSHFSHARRRPPAWQHAATARKHVDTAPMFDAGTDVWSINPLLAEQQLGRSRDWRGTEHLQFRNAPGAHVPPLQHQPRIVETVVVVEMTEERMADVHGTMPALQ